jgi:hypothetical protein
VREVRADQRQLTLWMSNGGRPAAAPPAEVEVYLDDAPIGSATIQNGFAPYTFEVSPPLASRIAAKGRPVRLKLVSSIWSPEQLLGTPDDRELGVMVDRVALK